MILPKAPANLSQERLGLTAVAIAMARLGQIWRETTVSVKRGAPGSSRGGLRHGFELDREREPPAAKCPAQEGSGFQRPGARSLTSVFFIPGRRRRTSVKYSWGLILRRRQLRIMV